MSKRVTIQNVTNGVWVLADHLKEYGSLKPNAILVVDEEWLDVECIAKSLAAGKIKIIGSKAAAPNVRKGSSFKKKIEAITQFNSEEIPNNAGVVTTFPNGNDSVVPATPTTAGVKQDVQQNDLGQILVGRRGRRKKLVAIDNLVGKAPEKKTKNKKNSKGKDGIVSRFATHTNAGSQSKIHIIHIDGEVGQSKGLDEDTSFVIKASDVPGGATLEPVQQVVEEKLTKLAKIGDELLESVARDKIVQLYTTLPEPIRKQQIEKYNGSLVMLKELREVEWVDELRILLTHKIESLENV